MAQLTDEELRDAAAEAGISPNELRHALAVREGGDDADLPATASVMGGPARGIAVKHAEGRIQRPPRDALAAVRTSIEKQSGKSGHNQGEDEADIVDDDAGLTYRIRSRDDGAGGALVRIDIDPTQGRGLAALRGVSVGGVTVAMIGLAWLFSSTLLWLGAAGVGILGAYLVAKSFAGGGLAARRAQGIAAQALVDAEEGAIAGALPPASR